MDPVSAIGLASSIVQFVDLATKLVRGTQEIYESGDGADKTNADYELSARELENLCERLKTSTAFSPSADEAALLNLAEVCQDIAKELSALLKDTRASNPASKWRCLVAALKTQLKKGQRELLVNRLSQCRAQLDLQLTQVSRLDQQASQQKILHSLQSNEEGLKLALGHMKALRDNIPTTILSPEVGSHMSTVSRRPKEMHPLITDHDQVQKRRGELARLESHVVDHHSYASPGPLSPGTPWTQVAAIRLLDNETSTPLRKRGHHSWYLDPRHRQHHIQQLAEFLHITDSTDTELYGMDEVRLEGTCAWFSWKQSYCKWRDFTAESPRALFITGQPASGKSILASYLINDLRSGSAKCSFFFFKHADTSKRTLSSCLRALALQMAHNSDSVLAKLMDIKRNTNPGTFSYEIGDDRMVWRKLFVNGVFQMQLDEQFWVIDALDECSSDFATVKAVLAKPSREISLRILLTSRETPTLLAEATNFDHDMIRIEKVSPEDNFDDITTLVNSKAPMLLSIDEDSRERITQQILLKSQGSFLWVALVLKELCHAHSEHEIIKALENIPSGMRSLYVRAVEQMSQLKRDKSAAKAILIWAACATRPLTLKEFREILGIGLKDVFPRLDVTISTVCGQLLTIDKNDNVHFVHETAREFLMEQVFKHEFVVDAVTAHTRIARICLEYLTGEGMKNPRFASRRIVNEAVAKRSALAAYACTSFSYHLSKADHSSPELAQLLVQLFNGNVLSWIAFVCSESSMTPIVEAAKDISTYLSSSYPQTNIDRLELERLTHWTTDLTRIAARFGNALITSPSAAFALIPALCPTRSAIHKAAVPQSRFSVQGLSNSDWDDRLSYIDFHATTRCVCYGDMFFAVGLTDGTIAIYYALTGQLYRTLQHKESVKLLIFVENAYIASYGTRSIIVWDLDNGEAVHSLAILPECIALTYDNGILSAACTSNCLISWDLEHGGSRLPDRPWNWGPEDRASRPLYPASAVAILTEQKVLAVASLGRPITLWDMDEDVHLGNCGAQTSVHYVTALVFNPKPDSSLLAASYLDGKLHLYDYLEDVSLKNNRANCAKIASSPDGYLLAGAAGFGVIDVFGFESLDLLYRIRSSNLGVKQLAFDSNGLNLIDIRGSVCNVWQLAALYGEPNLNASDAHSPHAVLEVVAAESKMKITTVTIHADSNCVICGGDDGSVSAYDLQSGTLVTQLYRQKSQIRALGWSREEQTVLSIDVSNSIVAWTLSCSPRALSATDDQQFESRLDCENTVEQLLLKDAGNDFIMSTRISDHWWSLQGQTEHACIIRDKPSVRKWVQHPVSPDHVMCMEETQLEVYQWSSRHCIEQISHQCHISGMSIKSLTTNMIFNTATLLVEVSELDGGPDTCHVSLVACPALKMEQNIHSNTVGNVPHLLDSTAETLEEPESSTNTTLALMRDDQMRQLSRRVSHVIGILSSGKLLFLDGDSWICSFDFENGEHQKFQFFRHFFVPHDWFSGRSERACAISGQDVIFGRSDGIVVVKGGFGFSEQVTI